MPSHYVYGLHAVKKKLQLSHEDCLEMMCLKNSNQRLQQNISLATSKGVRVVYVDKDNLTALADTDKHQGCLLHVNAEQGQSVSIKELTQKLHPKSLILVLDGVQDPHNLGACLRTADGAGVAAVIVPKDRAVGITPVVRKVAAGAAESIPLITVSNLSRSLKELKDAGVWVVGTTGEAKVSLFDESLTGPIALVMGAEGEGIRRLTAEQCDYLVKLPMKGEVESLNVSVATGICLYEIIRKLSV